MKSLLLIALITLFASAIFISAESEFATPAAGKLLVADKTMLDPRFIQTVILLFRYSKDGAAGLILNHPTNVNVSKIFPEIPGLHSKNEFLHFGGPVAADTVFLLVQGKDPGDKAERVFQNVFISADKSVMQEELGHIKGQEKLHVYHGYAGWGAGQLDMEIAGGHWHVLPADTKAIFYSDPEKVWQEYLERSDVLQASLIR
ncbi:YqgE/AlgH family protein [bacterium]|nr:YqgE/AlgH family protein [bacterium]